jgi:hypothetical protein
VLSLPLASPINEGAFFVDSGGMVGTDQNSQPDSEELVTLPEYAAGNTAPFASSKAKMVSNYTPSGRFPGTVAARACEDLVVLDGAAAQWLLVRTPSGETGWLPRAGVSPVEVAETAGRARFDAAAFFGIPERHWVLLCLCLVFACEWIDRSLLLIALEPIKLDLGLSDTATGVDYRGPARPPLAPARPPPPRLAGRSGPLRG